VAGVPYARIPAVKSNAGPAKIELAFLGTLETFLPELAKGAASCSASRL
jgi:hypothetical protein